MKANFKPTITVSALFLENVGPNIQLEDDSGIILLEDGGELLLEDVSTNRVLKATFNAATTIKGNF